MRNRCAFQKRQLESPLRGQWPTSFFVRAFSPPLKISSPDRNPSVVIDVYTLFRGESEDPTAAFLGHFQAKNGNFQIRTYCPSTCPAENITVSFFRKTVCAKTTSNENKNARLEHRPSSRPSRLSTVNYQRTRSTNELR
jgi:hypothetical protein